MAIHLRSSAMTNDRVESMQPVTPVTYDRRAIIPGIVHIGVGNFHRAHEAFYVDRLLRMGIAATWGISGIGIMPADARMRDGQPSSAVDILKLAYERTPADDQIVRRLAMAYVVMARHADALPLLDTYLQRQPTDEEALFAAVLAQYEVVRAGQTLSSVDRAKMRRYAAAYRGTERALVDKYLEVMQAR